MGVGMLVNPQILFAVVSIISISCLIEAADIHPPQPPQPQLPPRLDLSPAEKEKCLTHGFLKISKYRRGSSPSFPLSRRKADHCCRLRGMKLYSGDNTVSIEPSPLKFVDLLQEQIKEDWHWSSGNSFQDGGRYVWGSSGEQGAGVEDDQEQKGGHEWVEGNPGVGRCLLVKGDKEKGKILMKTGKCKKAHPFICEMEPQLGGKDLTVRDLMNCVGSNYTDVPGYPALKIFETVGSWRMATHCCQSRGWSLIDNLVSKGHRFFDSLTLHPWALGPSPDHLQYWTGGNDFEKFREWKWSCGETPEGEDLSWFVDEEKNILNPDNAGEKGEERCLGFGGRDAEKGFQGEDMNCEEIGSIICDMNPACQEDKQYQTNRQPRRYDLRDSYSEDMETCKSIAFTPRKPEKLRPELENMDRELHFGDKPMSWAAAMKCCADHGMEGLKLDKRNIKTMMDLIMYQDSIKDGPTSWSPNATYWLPASNIKGPLRSKMKWMDDSSPIKSYLLSKVRVHDDIHPLCAQLGYIPPLGFFVHSGNCGNKNLVICAKKVGAGGGGANGTAAAGPSASSLVSFQDREELYNRSLTPPNEQDKQYKFFKRSRDVCPNGPDGGVEEYKKTCPQSLSDPLDIMKDPVNPKGATNSEQNEEMKYRLNHQSKRILETLVEEALVGFASPKFALPLSGFKFLGASAEILAKSCPMVPPTFVRNAFKLFQDLHVSEGDGRTEIITRDKYKWILKMLDKCHGALKPVKGRSDGCGDKMMAVDNCTSHICTDPKHEPNIGKYDPLIDIMWKAFELTQSVCFPFFEESYRMLHQYARAIMDLWTEELRFRWFNPPKPKDDSTPSALLWQRALGPKYHFHLLNLERCVTASVNNAYFRVRMQRETIISRGRLLDEQEFIKIT